MFSHHPLCENYRKEVFKFNRFFICRGCTFFYSSFTISFLYLMLFVDITELGLFNLFIITNILAFSSFFGSVKKTQIRNLKDFYRVSLGIAVSIPFVTIIQTNFIEEKLIIAFFMFIYFIAFKLIREKLSTDHLLCKNCTEFSNDACINYNAVFVSERNHSRIISDYLQKKIRYSRK